MVRPWRGVLGGPLVLALVLGAATGCSSGEGGEASPAAALKVGDCVQLAIAGQGGADAGSLATVDCAAPHQGEVVLASDGFFAEDAQLPPEQRLQSLADTACTDAMVTYSGTGPQEASVRMSYLYPTSATWESGDRRLTCIAVAYDAEADGIAETTGSLASS